MTGLMLAGYTATAQVNWSFDKAHTNIEFSVQHLVISDVTGKFGSFEGKVVSKGDDFSGSDVSFTVDVSSVNTGNEKRDGHLKSDDFFNAKEFPEIKFTNGILKQVEGKNYTLTGDLTIRDITKPVEMEVKHGGTIKDPYGNTKAGFKVKGTINRFDYNMKFDAAMEAGGLVVGEEVDIVCNVELKKES
ncbi:MAG: polyisoprenoid-binding protein [Cyclobacteriaceae bacterium]|nr:MAG: polyisoprenoid-binding protein [Cyclobacteriaceae bacterium]